MTMNLAQAEEGTRDLGWVLEAGKCQYINGGDRQ